jgi:hypothetical protein
MEGGEEDLVSSKQALNLIKLARFKIIDNDLSGT